MAIAAYGDRGTVDFDGHVVTITIEAAMSTTRGPDVQRLAVDRIASVDLSKAGAIVAGRIVFNVPGAPNLAYSMPFSRSDQAGMEALRDAVQSAIEHRGGRHDDGTAGLLTKLADLHNAGVLTDDEFAAAKARAIALI